MSKISEFIMNHFLPSDQPRQIRPEGQPLKESENYLRKGSNDEKVNMYISEAREQQKNPVIFWNTEEFVDTRNNDEYVLLSAQRGSYEKMERLMFDKKTFTFWESLLKQRGDYMLKNGIPRRFAYKRIIDLLTKEQTTFDFAGITYSELLDMTRLGFITQNEFREITHLKKAS